jgi:hypothetical protein
MEMRGRQQYSKTGTTTPVGQIDNSNFKSRNSEAPAPFVPIYAGFDNLAALTPHVQQSEMHSLSLEAPSSRSNVLPREKNRGPQYLPPLDEDLYDRMFKIHEPVRF